MRRFLAAMPKAELHLHFEGAIRPPDLLELARRRGVPLPASDEEGIRAWLRFGDFHEFVQIYLAISRCLRDPEDFQFALDRIAAEQERQSVLYSELHLTISTHEAHGANIGEVGDALGEAIERARGRRGVELRLIADIVRNLPPDRADLTIEWALENRHRGVVALGLAGVESHPIEPFREHFKVAAAEGLHRVVHAGEQRGPDSIRSALAVCGAERIGHGFRAVDDAALTAELAARGVPLEICPTSNVRLGLVPDLERHPLGRLEEAGVTWTLNSDDPPLFGTTLNREYREVHRVFGLSPARLAGVSVAAVRHAFLPEERRRELEDGFRERFEALGDRYLGAPVTPDPGPR